MIEYYELRKIDTEAADKIDMNNVRRVIRALEIFKVTGKTKTQLDKESIKEAKYDYKMYGIEWERSILYERIEKRVDIMLEEGLIEEVKALTSKYKLSKTAIQGLGYKEVIEYLENNISYEEMVDKLKMETRRYAKRQLTWFRKNKETKWLNMQEGTQKNIQIILEEL
jgi:tRNA dimethylallyltransferase